MSWSIQVENLGKQYRKDGRVRLSNNFRESLMGLLRRTFSKREKPISSKDPHFWALRNVSFEIAEGEMVGVIGRNGAGKSTLLKLLSRITPPTEGVLRYRGRLTSLLEIGTGFHSQLTGRENIFLNGSILGLSRTEIKKKLDQIVSFAGAEAFLDTPVKFYSSGMYMRLAFSVAAHLEADILLVDEVLAVGDAEFQKRCTRRMNDVARSGRTVILVSHNMGLIQHHCSRGIFLDRGQIAFDGPIHEAVHAYLASQEKTQTTFEYPDDYPRRGSGIFRVRSVRFETESAKLSKLVCGRHGKVILDVEVDPAKLPIRDANFAVTFYSLDGVRLSNFWSRASQGELTLNEKRVKCELHIPRVPFRPGEYRIEIWAARFAEPCDWIEDAGVIEIGEGDFYRTGISTDPDQGAIFCEHSWKVL